MEGETVPPRPLAMVSKFFRSPAFLPNHSIFEVRVGWSESRHVNQRAALPPVRPVFFPDQDLHRQFFRLICFPFPCPLESSGAGTPCWRRPTTGPNPPQRSTQLGVDMHPSPGCVTTPSYWPTRYVLQWDFSPRPPTFSLPTPQERPTGSCHF